MEKIPTWSYVLAISVVGIVFIAILAVSNDSFSGAEEDTIEIAENLGLDVDKFREDLQSSEIENLVEDSKAEAEEIGVTGTPTIVIDGQIYNGSRDISTLRNLIQENIDSRENISEPFTMTVYSDHNCINCASFEPVKIQLSEEFAADEFFFEEKFFPFLDGTSYDYARAVEAARLQGAGVAMSVEIYKLNFSDRVPQLATLNGADYLEESMELEVEEIDPEITSAPKVLN